MWGAYLEKKSVKNCGVLHKHEIVIGKIEAPQ